MILAIDRKPVRFASHENALQFFGGIRPGTQMRLDVLREGRRIQVVLIASPMPRAFVGAVEDNPRKAQILDKKP
ncbi:MAG TPA: hypothetical protein VGR02_05190 [Thermoanaerobaculia bacterium]|jgi:hypothetical protein|nr:hypothetical protein [Thermoanaerobaculia bacterium]